MERKPAGIRLIRSKLTNLIYKKKDY